MLGLSHYPAVEQHLDPVHAGGIYGPTVDHQRARPTPNLERITSSLLTLGDVERAGHRGRWWRALDRLHDASFLDPPPRSVVCHDHQLCRPRQWWRQGTIEAVAEAAAQSVRQLGVVLRHVLPLQTIRGLSHPLSVEPDRDLFDA
jgi:hypothetical protein